ncbi:late embryogenesis abundant protein [Striga asiatica]|uniref:Late embryogenesis abundant protein n=1 Tax=Striga asiatica TaxID=4170 RepID=A0A5A7RBC8_STRAF|nr:late embryogenesis abundant protein [Striga asiatica]
MGDKRVYPATVNADPLPLSSASATPSPNFSSEQPKPPNPPPSHPVPPPATYVVQFPREQILRYPSPENARKFQTLARRRNRRSCCRRCCCFSLCLLLLLAVAAAISAGSLYLVFRFRSPRYTVTGLAARGLNVTSAASMTPGFDVAIGAENPNGRVGIYYLRGSSVNVLFDGVRLGGGALPVFFQPRRNVTALRTAVTGSRIVLGGDVRTALRDGKNRRRIPFVVRVKAPVKFKVGTVRTWEITVKVKCDVVLDSLDEKARILSRDCDYTL